MRRLNIRKAITVAVLLIGAVGLGEALEGSYVPVGISDGRLVVEEVLSGKRMCIVNDLWVPMADAPVEVEGKAGQLISLASDGLSVGSGADQRSVSAIGAPGFDPGRVGHAAVDVCRRPWPGRAGLGVDFREEQTPALGDFAFGPPLCAVGIGFHHDVQVITHGREGQHIDGEGLDLGFDALFQPRSSVLGGITAEKCPPHTATDQVKNPRSGILNDKAAGRGRVIRVIMDPYHLQVKASVFNVGVVGLRCC